MDVCIPALLCMALLPSSVSAVDHILGDKVTFKCTESCKKSGATLVQWLKDGSHRPVARWDGDWKPEPGYEDRLSPGDFVTFNRTNINDNGLYVLTCGQDPETRTSLYIAPASEALVPEGEPLRLEYHHVTAGKRGKFRLERNGELVLELDLSSSSGGEMRWGTGFEDRLTVSPDWKVSGDLTVTLQRVKSEDQGDFFLYVQDEDITRPREGVSAVRLKIRAKIPDQTTHRPTPPAAAAGMCLTQREMITWIAVCSIFAVVLMAFAFCCGRWGPRFWKLNAPCGPGGTSPTPTDEAGVEMRPLNGGCSPDSHVNGSRRPNGTVF